MAKSSSEIEALIKRRRLQLLVHSSIYYDYNENIVSDNQWKDWALELEQLQHEYPELANKVEYAEAFKDFDHSTGYNLPYRDDKIREKAIWLMRLHDKRKD